MHIFTTICSLSTVVFIAISCSDKSLDAQQVIDKSIEAYGGKQLYTSDIEFDFRDKHYRSYTNWDEMSYERMFEDDSLGDVHDVLNNDGFTRTVNGRVVELDEEWTGKYSQSVNSVIYFFRIPFNLNDAAVNKELLPDATIRGKEYYKVRILFDQEDGGEDYQDHFIYWVHKETFIIDYFAYSYSTDGGGKRFREMINIRDINGLKVVDYINYEPKNVNTSLEDFDTYFEQSGMEELSRIENQKIVVKYL